MTPPTSPAAIVELRIDDRAIRVPAGTTLLEACTRAGVDLPTLCFVEGLSTVGACRLCLVNLAGRERPLAACTAEAEAGMVVTTQGSGLALWRRLAVELLFQEGNHVCAFCVASGHCELQALAVRLGVDHLRYPALRPQRRVDGSHPRYLLDHNLCVLCGRCVRVCAEVEGARVWELAERGSRTRLVAGLDQPWGEVSACTSCGKCLQLCPTGALAEKGLTTGEKSADPTLISRLKPTRPEAKAGLPNWAPPEPNR